MVNTLKDMTEVIQTAWDEDDVTPEDQKTFLSLAKTFGLQALITTTSAEELRQISENFTDTSLRLNFLEGVLESPEAKYLDNMREYAQAAAYALKKPTLN